MFILSRIFEDLLAAFVRASAVIEREGMSWMSIRPFSKSNLKLLVLRSMCLALEFEPNFLILSYKPFLLMRCKGQLNFSQYMSLIRVFSQQASRWQLDRATHSDSVDEWVMHFWRLLLQYKGLPLNEHMNPLWEILEIGSLPQVASLKQTSRLEIDQGPNVRVRSFIFDRYFQTCNTLFQWLRPGQLQYFARLDTENWCLVWQVPLWNSVGQWVINI